MSWNVSDTGAAVEEALHVPLNVNGVDEVLDPVCVAFEEAEVLALVEEPAFEDFEPEEVMVEDLGLVDVSEVWLDEAWLVELELEEIELDVLELKVLEVVSDEASVGFGDGASEGMAGGFETPEATHS